MASFIINVKFVVESEDEELAYNLIDERVVEMVQFNSEIVSGQITDIEYSLSDSFMNMEE